MQASGSGNKRAKGTALSQNVDIREQNVRSKNLYLTEVVKQAVVAGAYHDVAVLRLERLQHPRSIRTVYVNIYIRCFQLVRVCFNELATLLCSGGKMTREGSGIKAA